LEKETEGKWKTKGKTTTIKITTIKTVIKRMKTVDTDNRGKKMCIILCL
jgi:hypothetical protein